MLSLIFRPFEYKWFGYDTWLIFNDEMLHFTINAILCSKLFVMEWEYFTAIINNE